TPTAEEIRRMDISIGPTGEELPPGRGTAKEGARVFEEKGCIACHGPAGLGGMAPGLQSKKGQDVPIWQKERILPLRSPFATTVWDYIRRGMPAMNEGTLTANEVYSLTAYLLFLNKVIAEDEVLDQQSLPKVKCRLAMITPSCMSGRPGRQGLRVTPTSMAVQKSASFLPQVRHAEF